MSRKEELLKIIDDNPALVPLIDEMVYLEGELDFYRTLPKIKIHSADKSKQKATPAAKLYKEYLQQYTNIVRIIIRATGIDENEEESPLRRWINEHTDK